jgi:hypothetical protein
MIKDNQNAIDKINLELRALKSRKEILKETLNIYIGELKK